jgi:tetratricopeptide (TPR) repeat protein
MRKRLLLYTALLATALAAVQPCRNLLASYFQERAAAVLDDPSTPERDVLEISEQTLPLYREAIRSLGIACRLAPSRPIFRKALGDLYLRMGGWSAAMESMGQLPLPAEAISGNDGFRAGRECLRTAVLLEPANPDLHLDLANAYSLNSENGPAERELRVALQAAPMNSALRYEIAVRYLREGRNQEALEQAEILASFDDSYRLRDSPVKQFMMDRRTNEYRALLARSYLFKALEIGWRASGKNTELVRRMVPPGDEAQQVWQLFGEWKGF